MAEKYIDTPELARRTNKSESFWNKKRVSGDGPPYITCGRSILYAESDVEAWLASQKRTSTSDTGKALSIEQSAGVRRYERAEQAQPAGA